MEITNNKLNSLPEQVEENMKNIQLLASYLKEAYQTPLTLVTTATSTPIASTNAPSDTTDGWLITSDGKLFKINGGDGVTLLIKYYCTFPKGDKGDTGDTGADGTDGADGKNGYSIRVANVDSNGATTQTINDTDIINNVDIIDGDVVLFKNGYIGIINSYVSPTIDIDNIIALDIESIPTITIENSQIIDSTHFNLTPDQSTLLSNHPSFINLIINGVNIPLTLEYSTGNNQHYINTAYFDNPVSIIVFDYNFDTLYNNCVVTQDSFGKGKQLYQHNVSLYYVYNSRTLNAFFTIVNDSNQALTYQDIYDYLDDLNLKYNGNQYNRLFGVTGRYENTAPTPSEYANVFGMYINTQNEGYIRFAYMLLNGSVNYLAFSSATIYDYIKTI